jgi:hypothetical protein
MDPKKLQSSTYTIKWSQPYSEWASNYEVLERSVASDNYPDAREALSKFTLNGL